ncbi:hypothetical protein [Luteolibacter sp. AS25]|uniref:hypothetical protein n=1 Tax=Luteolibacter sp. AS25 TaxID=3135776 RepID=UPI00398A6339
MKILVTAFLFGIAHAEPAKELWPEKPFEHVVAYCYTPFRDDRGSSITFDDGSLNTGIIQATTVRLNADQTNELRKILSTDSDSTNGGVLCYYSHHAFVFYDADWKVTASIDICFQCSDYKHRSGTVSDSIDLAVLKAFCSRIGLPMFKDSPGYSKLFAQEQPPRPTKSTNKQNKSEMATPRKPSD